MEEQFQDKKSGVSTLKTIIITFLLTVLLCIIVFRVLYYNQLINEGVGISAGGETLAATISGDFTSGERRALEKALLQNKMNKVKNMIDSEYLYDYDFEKMLDYVAIGLLASIDDPYAQYYDKEAFESFYTQTEGEYCGIGIYVTYDKKKESFAHCLKN